MAKSLLPIDELFYRFYVDSTSPSGLRYADNFGSRARKGEAAGTKLANGYHRVRINGSNFFTHRIVMALRCGYDLVDMTVDHKDRDQKNLSLIHI